MAEELRLGVVFDGNSEVGVKALQKLADSFEKFVSQTIAGKKSLSDFGKTAQSTGTHLQRFYQLTEEARERASSSSQRYITALEQMIREANKEPAVLRQKVEALNKVERAINEVSKAYGFETEEGRKVTEQLSRYQIANQLLEGILNRRKISVQQLIVEILKEKEGYQEATLVATRLSTEERKQREEEDRLATTKKKLAEATAKAKEEAKRLAQEQKEGSKQASIYSRMLNAVWKSLKTVTSYGTAIGIVYQLTNAIRAGVNEIHEYDQALHNLKAITGATFTEMDAMAEVIKSVASKTKFSASEVGYGMVLLGQAGFSAQEAIAGMEHISTLATGTISSLQDSVDLTTTAIRAFRINAEDSQRVVDVFANAVNKSKLTIDKLRIAMSYIGPVARSAGLQLEDTAAAMMILANSGVRASTIGTSLRQAISRLLNPTKKFTDLAMKMGGNFDNLNPMVSDFRTVIEELSQVVPDAGAAFQMFGLRAAPAVTALIREGTEGFDLMKAYTERAGSAAKMAAEQQEGLAISLKNLKDKLGLVAVAMGENGLIGAFKVFYDITRSIVDGITYLVGTTFVKAIAGATAFGTALYLLVKSLTATKVAVVALNSKFPALLAFLKPNPFILVASAIIGLGIALSSLMSSQKDAVKELAENDEVLSKNIKGYEAQKKSIDASIRVLDSARASTEAKAVTLRDLSDTMGIYSQKTDEATVATGDFTEVIKAAKEESSRLGKDIEKMKLERIGEKGKSVDILFAKLTRLGEEISRIQEKIKAVESGKDIFVWGGEKDPTLILRNSLEKYKKAYGELADSLVKTEEERRSLVKEYLYMTKEDYYVTLRNIGVNKELASEQVKNYKEMTASAFKYYIDRTGLAEDEKKVYIKAFNEIYAVMNKGASSASVEARKASNEILSALEEGIEKELKALKKSKTDKIGVYEKISSSVIDKINEYVAESEKAFQKQKDLAAKEGKDVTDFETKLFEQRKDKLKEYVEAVKSALDKTRSAWKSYYDKLWELQSKSEAMSRKAEEETRKATREDMSAQDQAKETLSKIAEDENKLIETIKEKNRLEDEYQKTVKSGAEEADIYAMGKAIEAKEDFINYISERLNSYVDELKKAKDKEVVKEEEVKDLKLAIIKFVEDANQVSTYHKLQMLEQEKGKVKELSDEYENLLNKLGFEVPSLGETPSLVPSAVPTMPTAPSVDIETSPEKKTKKEEKSLQSTLEAVRKYKEGEFQVEKEKVEKEAALLKAEVEKKIKNQEEVAVRIVDIDNWKDEEIRKLQDKDEDNRLKKSTTFMGGLTRAWKDYTENVRDHSKVAVDIFTSATDNMTDAIVNFVETGKFSFRDFTNTVINDILAILVKMMAMKVVAASLGWAMPDVTAKAAKGLAYERGKIIELAKGGIVNKPTLLAEGNVVAGEAGAEGVLPLKRMSDGDLGVKASGMTSNVEVNIYNQSEQPVQASKKDVRFDLQKVIIDLWLDGFTRDKGGLRTALGGA